MEWHEVFGVFGVALIVGTYFLLQVGKLSSQTLVFSLLNGMGAVLVLLSLTHDFNLSAFIVELFWLLISLFGIGKNMMGRVSRPT